MNTNLLIFLVIAFAASACDTEHVENRSDNRHELHLIGRPDKGTGKIIITTGENRGCLLLGGNHIFASGRKIAENRWKLDVLRLKPSQQEASIEIGPGQQVFLNDEGQTKVIDGVFDLSGRKPVWTGLYRELEPVIVSALESNTIAQQAAPSNR
jgi:hypothetical protein